VRAPAASTEACRTELDGVTGIPGELTFPEWSGD